MTKMKIEELKIPQREENDWNFRKNWNLFVEKE